jgi:hypothetical protein
MLNEHISYDYNPLKEVRTKHTSETPNIISKKGKAHDLILPSVQGSLEVRSRPS